MRFFKHEGSDIVRGLEPALLLTKLSDADLLIEYGKYLRVYNDFLNEYLTLRKQTTLGNTTDNDGNTDIPFINRAMSTQGYRRGLAELEGLIRASYEKLKPYLNELDDRNIVAAANATH